MQNCYNYFLFKTKHLMLGKKITQTLKTFHKPGLHGLWHFPCFVSLIKQMFSNIIHILEIFFTHYTNSVKVIFHVKKDIKRIVMSNVGDKYQDIILIIKKQYKNINYLISLWFWNFKPLPEKPKLKPIDRFSDQPKALIRNMFSPQWSKFLNTF